MDGPSIARRSRPLRWLRHRRRLAAALVLTPLAAMQVASALPASASSPTCSAEAADVASAVQMAVACGQRVEALNDRNEMSQTFVNPDGTGTLVTAAEPQRVHRGDGSWAAVDTTLHVAGGGLQPVASVADVTFSAGGSAPLVTWKDDGQTLTISWPSPLPAPTVSGDTVTYANVFPDVDLTATATRTGYTHTLVVKTAAAAANPALRQVHYTLGGDLRAQTTNDGVMQVVNAAGAAVAASAAASMWDSTFDPASAGEVLPGVTVAQPSSQTTSAESADSESDDGLASTPAEPGIGAVTAPVGVSLSGSDMAVAPDEALLSSPDATFPIFIDPPLNNLRSKWAYSDSSDVNNNDGRMYVGHNPDNGYNYRSYFEFDVSAIRSTTIISAEIDMVLDHSWSCTPTWVHLYRPGGNITVSSGGRMPWSSKPMGSSGTHLDSWEGNANEAGGCGSIQPDMDAVFDAAAIKTDLQAAATANWTLYTLGLCACNTSDQYESTQDRWKKFYSDKTYLVATYDLKPYNNIPQAFSTTTDCYAQCTSPAVVRSTQPKLKVTVQDPYGGVLRTIFEVRDAPSDTANVVAWNYSPWAPVNTSTTSVTTPGTSPAGTAEWQVPVALANGQTYYWRATTGDENGLWNGYTPWQTVTIDTDLPNPVYAASAEYPAKAWGAVVGTQGTFNLTAQTAGDVANFVWWVDNGAATTVGAGHVCEGTCYQSRSSITYPRPGIDAAKDMVHTMHVKAIDTAGNVSDTIDYQFWVKPLADRCWRWQLNEASGTTAADTGNLDSAAADPNCHVLTDNTTITAQPGTLSSGVSWTSDSTGAPRDKFATFNGTGQVTIPSGVVDTTRSFTVTAWVRASDLSATYGNQTIVSQDGSNASRFVLRYNKDANAGTGGWCFGMRSANTAGNVPIEACATGQVGSSTPPAVGEWVHLAGVYDATAGTIQIHVMGNQESCDGEMVSTTFTGSWTASGPLVVGRAYDGAAKDYWRGAVDNVYAFQRALAPIEICQQVG